MDGCYGFSLNPSQFNLIAFRICFRPVFLHYHYHLVLFFDQCTIILKPVTTCLLQPLVVFCGQETYHGYLYVVFCCQKINRSLGCRSVHGLVYLVSENNAC